MHFVIQSKIAIDPAGNAYVVGSTDSTNFPTSNPFQPASGGGSDAFVTKLNPSGSALVFSTYLGGSGFEEGAGMAVDSAGNAYVTGRTASTNFPATSGAFQTTFGGSSDAFVAKIGVPAIFLILDEDSIDNGTKSIEAISFNPPNCGAGSPAVCVNGDIAAPGVRTLLFTRGNDITPFSGLVLPTGQVGDEGLFMFTNPDPQVSLQNGATFTTSEFITATGAAADENNLDKIDGVVPLDEADIIALDGKTVCAVVYDSDVSVDVAAGFGSLKGATLGLTAFTVTAVGPDPDGPAGSVLPEITVDLLPSGDVQKVCESVVQ